MPGVRTVHVDGKPITWTEFVAKVGWRAEFCPVKFDVTKSMPVEQARQFEAWLRRLGLGVSIVSVRGAAGSASAGRKRSSMKDVLP